jgi:gas vesicle protein
MNPTSLDTQSGSAQDDHLARIVRRETQMDNVTFWSACFDDLRDRIDQLQLNTQGEINRLQDQIAKGQLATQGQLERLQGRIDQGQLNMQGQMERLQKRDDQGQLNLQDQINRLRDRIDQVHLDTRERIDRLQEQMDKNVRWLIGLMLANITAVAGLYVRMLLS